MQLSPAEDEQCCESQTLDLHPVIATFILYGVNNLESSDDPLDDVLDTKVFNDLRHRMVPDTLATLYRRFLSNAAETIASLRNQETAARPQTLHALKGSAAMLGAQRLAALAGCLQDDDLQSPTMLAQSIEVLEAELELFSRVIATRITLTLNGVEPV